MASLPQYQDSMMYYWKACPIKSKFNDAFEEMIISGNLRLQSTYLPFFLTKQYQIWETGAIQYQILRQWEYQCLEVVFSSLTKLPNIPYWIRSKAYLNGNRPYSPTTKNQIYLNTILLQWQLEENDADFNILICLQINQQKQTAYSLLAITSSKFQCKSPYYFYCLIINQNDQLTFHYLNHCLYLSGFHHHLRFLYRWILFVFTLSCSNPLFSYQNVKFMFLCQLLFLLFIMKQDRQ